MEAQDGRSGAAFETLKIAEDRHATDQQGNQSGVDVVAEINHDIAVSSPVTRQKVVAAKQFIENHYKNHLKNLQDRKERFSPLFEFPLEIGLGASLRLQHLEHIAVCIGILVLIGVIEGLHSYTTPLPQSHPVSLYQAQGLDQ